MVSTRSSSVGVASTSPTRRSPRKTRVPTIVSKTNDNHSDEDLDDDYDDVKVDESNAVTISNASKKRSSPLTHSPWSHTPTHLTLLWLAISLPLVIWDTCYILGRPYTMPGGTWHAPMWKPYGLYVRVDGVYGWQALEQNDGWPGAQGFVNAIETLAYLAYLLMAWRCGVDEAGSASTKVKREGVVTGLGRYLGEPRRVDGTRGAQMVVMLFATSVMTVGKTVLYWLIELFNGFAHIGHNPPWDLFWLWIVPNGLWLLFPSFMIYSSASDIIRGLSMAAGVTDRKPQGKLM